MCVMEVEVWTPGMGRVKGPSGNTPPQGKLVPQPAESSPLGAQDMFAHTPNWKRRLDAGSLAINGAYAVKVESSSRLNTAFELPSVGRILWHCPTFETGFIPQAERCLMSNWYTGGKPSAEIGVSTSGVLFRFLEGISNF